MAKREVIRMGHPTLKKVADLITQEEIHSEEFKDLIVDLYDTMKAYGGIGIAAPQVDISKQVTLIELPKHSERYGNLDESPLMVIINPVITTLDSDLQGFYEGCLSVPGLRGFVERPRKIQIDFLDADGIPQQIIAEGFLATVFQHEIDHLFGKLYVERMKDLSKLSYVEEFDHFNKKEKAENSIDD